MASFIVRRTVLSQRKNILGLRGSSSSSERVGNLPSFPMRFAVVFGSAAFVIEGVCAFSALNNDAAGFNGGGGNSRDSRRYSGGFGGGGIDDGSGCGGSGPRTPHPGGHVLHLKPFELVHKIVERGGCVLSAGAVAYLSAQKVLTNHASVSFPSAVADSLAARPYDAVAILRQAGGRIGARAVFYACSAKLTALALAISQQASLNPLILFPPAVAASLVGFPLVWPLVGVAFLGGRVVGASLGRGVLQNLAAKTSHLYPMSPPPPAAAEGGAAAAAARTIVFGLGMVARHGSRGIFTSHSIADAVFATHPFLCRLALVGVAVLAVVPEAKRDLSSIVVVDGGSGGSSGGGGGGSNEGTWSFERHWSIESPGSRRSSGGSGGSSGGDDAQESLEEHPKKYGRGAGRGGRHGSREKHERVFSQAPPFVKGGHAKRQHQPGAVFGVDRRQGEKSGNGPVGADSGAGDDDEGRGGYDV